MAHVEEAAACFTDHGKGGNDGGFESLAHGFAKGGLGRIEIPELGLNGLFQPLEAGLQLVIAKRLDLGFVLVDGYDERLQFFDVALMLGADKSRNDPIDNLCWIHEWLRFPPRSTAQASARVGARHQRKEFILSV